MVAWADYRDTTKSTAETYALRITSDGGIALGWNPDGTRVSAGRGWFLKRVEDGSGGAILAWSEQGFDGYEDLYAQRVTGAGHVAPGWPSFGVGVVVAPNGQWAEFSMAADGQEGRFAWRDDRGFLSSSSDIYAQRITGRERPQGGSPTVCGSRPRRSRISVP